jgi:hypothetical protein
MKNAVFWDVHRSWIPSTVKMEAIRSSVTSVNKIPTRRVYSYLFTLVHRSWISSTLKMEAIRSSETSVNKISTWRHIPEDVFFIVIAVKTSNLTR